MSRRRKNLGALDQSLIDFRAFDAISIEDDNVTAKKLDQIFQKIQNLERRLQTALNTREEDEEESKKNVREIGRLARLCCSYISHRGASSEQIEEEEWQREQQLLVSSAHWRIENYIDKRRSKRDLSDSYEFNVAVKPVLPEIEDSQVVKPETDNGDHLGESDGLDGESESTRHESGDSDNTSEDEGVRFGELEKLSTVYGVTDYQEVSLCEIRMLCRVITTVTHIQWNYYVGAGLKDINEADCYQYEEESARRLKGFYHQKWQMKDGDQGVILRGKLLTRADFKGDYDALMAQISFIKGPLEPDYIQWFEVAFKRDERTDEVVDEIDLRGDPKYIWGSIWLPGAYHGLWVWGLYASLGYTNIPKLLENIEIRFESHMGLDSYGSSKTEVLTVDDYVSVTNPLPTPGTGMPPTKADVSTSAHTKVYDVNGKLIFESDGLFDLAGILDRIPGTKSDIGQIIHLKNGEQSTFKPGDFD